MNEPELTSPLDLLRWVGWAQMKAGEEWTRERDLSRQQSFTLGFLAQNPGAIQRDIAQITRTTPASVSSLLQGLERRGLVERRPDPDNERIKRVYATPEGVELIEGFDVTMRQVEKAILSPLTPAEQEQLRLLLEKVTSVLERPSHD